MISCAMRRGPLCGGAGRGVGRGVGRACAVPDALPAAPAVAFTLGRFAGRLGALGGAPVGRGWPLEPVIVGFVCGRLAGRLDASIAPAGFCGGAPLALFAETLAAGFGGTGFAGTGFVTTGFATSFVAAFGAVFGFTAGFAAFTAGFATGFSAAFAAGLELPPMSLESSPFFSGMCCHVAHQVSNAAAVPPLVVVPGDYLHELVADHHRTERVDNRRAGVALVV